MKETKLLCYVCGKEIDPKIDFAITSPSPDGVDRAFFVHTGDCLEEIGNDHEPVIVRSVDFRQSSPKH